MIRKLKVTAMATLALTAVFASPASAAKPEFRFTLSGTEAEEKNQKKLMFKFGATVLESVAKSKVKCAAGSGDGEIEAGKGATSSKKVTEVFITFTGCEEPLLKKPCTTTGHSSGEIVTKTLEGPLGYISEPQKEVGLDLWAKSRTATERTNHTFNALLATFRCETLLLESQVSGSVIGKITPVNTKVFTNERLMLKYQQTNGVQAVTKLKGVEGEVKDVPVAELSDEPPAEAGLETTNEITPGTTLEVSA
jgi:hypothetical protein